MEQMKAQQKEAAEAGQQVLSAGLSAEYMRARIQALTTILIKRFADILDVAIDKTVDLDQPEEAPPSVVETADKQLAVDGATMQMVRAAEELMVLTRTMKEIWLFGDLDTLEADQTPREQEKKKSMQQDEQAVVKGLQEWLRKNGQKISGGQPEGMEDTSMADD